MALVKCWKTFFKISIEGQCCFHHVKEVFSFGKRKISSYYEWRVISTAGKRKPVKLVSHSFSVSRASESAQEIIFWYKKMERNIWPYNILISLYFLRKNLCRFYSKSNMMKIKVFSASWKLLKGNASFRSISIRTSIYSCAAALSQTCKNDYLVSLCFCLF